MIRKILPFKRDIIISSNYKKNVAALSALIHVYSQRDFLHKRIIRFYPFIQKKIKNKSATSIFLFFYTLSPSYSLTSTLLNLLCVMERGFRGALISPIPLAAGGMCCAEFGSA